MHALSMWQDGALCLQCIAEYVTYFQVQWIALREFFFNKPRLKKTVDLQHDADWMSVL